MHTGMNWGKFYPLAVIALGLSSAAMADDNQVVSVVPLMDAPTQQEQMAAALQTTILQQQLNDVSIAHYLKTNQSECRDCDLDDQQARLNYSRRFTSAQYQWRDQSSVGVSLRSGETSFGLWGDVREVNIVENEELSLLPSGLSTSVTTVPAAVVVSPGLAVSDSTGGGGAISDSPAPVATRGNIGVSNADASFNRAPVQSTFVGIGANSSGARPATGGAGQSRPPRIQSFSTATSDLAYKEYMGGLFVSQSF